MTTINLPEINQSMYSNTETAIMQILSNCEDIDFIDDLLPANEDLEQFFINL